MLQTRSEIRNLKSEIRRLVSYTFEICAPNLQSAEAAKAAGAHRIELCAALELGGLTPSAALISWINDYVGIPVHALIRPRDGNFCYSPSEVGLITQEVKMARDAGAAGVVVGALTADNALDLESLARWRDAAGTLEVTNHRAFDFAKDPFEALEQLIALGYARVLSSGQAPTAFEGRFLLQRLVAQAAGRITVMPGSGIDANNIKTIASDTGATQFHFTGKGVVQQPAGSLPGLSNTYLASQPDNIRAIIHALTH